MRLVHCLERRWLADSPPQLTQHRDINIRGIGYVASEIAKNHGIAICAPVAPYDVTRGTRGDRASPGLCHGVPLDSGRDL